MIRIKTGTHKIKDKDNSRSLKVKKYEDKIGVDGGDPTHEEENKVESEGQGGEKQNDVKGNTSGNDNESKDGNER